MSQLDEDSRQSRNEAKYFRAVILRGCKGYCEICGFFCHPITHIHHVIPVCDGGDGGPDNLIALCPNCHACVHKLKQTQRTGDEIGLSKIMSYLEITYTENQIELFAGIAFGSAVRVDDKWTPGENPLRDGDKE